MNHLRNKSRRIERVRQVKSRQKDAKSYELDQVLRQVQELERALQRTQEQYRSGVQRLNSLRQSSHRKGMEIFEDSVDFAKNQWMELFQKKHHAESQRQSLTMAVHVLDKQIEKLDAMQGELKKQLERERLVEMQAEVDSLSAQNIQGRGP